ncbi:MAG TPA: Hsp20/alpha crystallin family protein [Woeseiaceae bacterium]|nr:Hsp20/alpha crystallin family protein [Woeseiaceae bacterium]
MALGEMVPWRWGSLRRAGRDERSLESFRDSIASLHREMDRLFESLWQDGFGLSPLAGDWTRLEPVPRLDVSEDDKGFTVKVDLPGMDEKNVDVTLTDRVLTIRGRREEDTESKDKDYYRRERTFGAFRRSIEIPAEVDVSKISASFKKGVLTIELPKTPAAQEKVKRIEVKAA